MKLWSNENTLDADIEQFTIGKDQQLDMELAIYDVISSEAHAKMLAKIGILNTEELTGIIKCLHGIKKEIEEGSFKIDENVEDIHSQIEFMLTDQLGETGKKIHTGRSRNDQVLTDLKLLYRDKLSHLSILIKDLIELFLEKSDQHKAERMPGYTHSQIAMVSSFGLWFGSFAEALIDDLSLVIYTNTLLNKNPLGSAAGYGSNIPIDRMYTTELLQFDELCVNSIYAQFCRGKSDIFLANALTSVAYTLNKFASDICLFTGKNYDLILLPDELTTGSSIMPHKKNPDVFELIRARTNQLLSLPNQVFMLTNNLMTGYHRDYQLLKELMLPALQNCIDILNVSIFGLKGVNVNPKAIQEPRYDHLYSVDQVNQLVMQGHPFREAYQNIAHQIKSGKFNPEEEMEYRHIGSIGNLGNDLLRARLLKLF